MLVETSKKPKPAAPLLRRMRPFLKFAGLVVLAGVVASLGVAAVLPTATWKTLKEIGENSPALKEMAGLGAFSSKQKILKTYAADVSRVTDRLGHLPNAFLRDSDFPNLVLDIKFKHLRKISAQRDAAIKLGRRVPGEDDFVPAKLKFGGVTHRVKIRLKGDRPDHYDTKKWSFRVKINRGGHIYGMRRFSLQAPKTRQYHGQLIYLDFMRQFGVLAPRYHFVNMWVNGSNIGVMAVEEHFAKELVESQSRRDSVMLAFDDVLAWERYEVGGREFSSFFFNFTNARVKAFRDSRIAKSKQLSANYRVAVGLLRGVIDGTLAPSRAFNLKTLGRYLAILQLWHSGHDIEWYNVRFYYDPIAARLEPVAFDAQFAFWSPEKRLVEAARPLTLHLLADPEVFDSYHDALKEITAYVLSDKGRADLGKRETNAWLNLAGEFPLLERFPFDKLRQRARWLRSLSKAELRLTKDNPDARAAFAANMARPLLAPFSRLVHTFRVIKGNRHYLELRNAMPEAIEIEAIKWETIDGAQTFPFQAEVPLSFPLRLPKKTLDVAAQAKLIPFVENDFKHPLRLIVETRRTAGERERVRSEVLPYVAALSTTPIPRASVAETVAQHAFLDWNEAANRLVVQKGDWLVTDDLVVPSGVTLEVAGGTRLRFQPGRALIAYGPLSFLGAADAPIILEGIAGRWQGVAVLQANDQSRWHHVQVIGTSGVQRGDWALTGGVTFYQSPVEMKSVRLFGNTGEDALNIVSTRFELIDVDIEGAASDAFDSDFSRGRIVGGVYKNIGGTSGGDGIDVSGSTVDIVGVRFDGVSDKALSIGEASQVEARKIHIQNASTGAASKDGSTLVLSESKIEEPRVAGMMAYQKKPTYGGSLLVAKDVVVTGIAPTALAQNGSRIIVDGNSIVTRKLNVDELYQTVMRKMAIQ